MKKKKIVKGTFKKEQLVLSELFKSNKDLLEAFLDKDNVYTIEEVQTIIENFLIRKVK